MKSHVINVFHKIQMKKKQTNNKGELGNIKIMIPATSLYSDLCS